MREQINNIAKLFNTTFLLYNMIDTTMEQEQYLYIPRQDRRMMKMYYKLYNMKRYATSYWVFEGMIIKHALTRNIVPLLAAEELCIKSNDE